MIRALLVEDHPGMRRAVRRLLERDDEVEVVGEVDDGEQALLAVDRLKPDVMLLDISMPRVDGFQVLRVLREKAWLTRVVVLTMYGTADIKERVLAAGAGALVTKQRAYSDLLPAIHAVIAA